MEVSFGAVDVRVTSDPALWAARMRRAKGLAPLPSDETTLLIGELEVMTDEGDPSSLEEIPSGYGPVPEDFVELASAEGGTEAGPSGCHEAAAAKSLAAPGEALKEELPGHLPCTACPLAFNRRRRLRAHWESHHAASHEAYRCPKAGCVRTFHKAFRLEMQRHLRQVHRCGDEELKRLKGELKLETVVSANGPASEAPPACLAEPSPQPTTKPKAKKEKRKSRPSPLCVQVPAEDRALQTMNGNPRPKRRQVASCPVSAPLSGAPVIPDPVAPPAGDQSAWSMAMTVIQSLQEERATWLQSEKESAQRIARLEKENGRLKAQLASKAKRAKEPRQPHSK